MAARYSFALANFHDSLIVLSGGASRESYQVVSSVDVYSIEADKWSSIASLNQARREHSSCCVGDYVYIAGG